MAKNGQRPPVIVVEPVARQKRVNLAQATQGVAPEVSPDEIKLRLKKLRESAVGMMGELAKQLQESATRYQNTSSCLAGDASQAISYIRQVTGDKKTIAIGISSVVKELKPGLQEAGYRLVDTYASQFTPVDVVDNTVGHQWQLEVPIEPYIWNSFNQGVEVELTLPESGTGHTTVMLGVNATSAEDGSFYFLQHSANLHLMLSQAEKLILVVGLEKIVPSRSDALFQARCIGAFGTQSILLDLMRGRSRQKVTEPGIQETPESISSKRETHIILLDNGRTNIARGNYAELLQCIGCRACAKQCPGYRYLNDFESYPREYLWSFLNGRQSSLDLCTFCGMCQYECPVDIRLPELIARARAEYCPQSAHVLSSRVLYNAPRLAPLGSRFAPIVNTFGRMAFLRTLSEKLVGIDRRRAMPTFHSKTFGKWLESHVGR